MGQRSVFFGVATAALLLAVAAVFPTASGQQQPSCLGSLISCSSSFLGGTKPSKDCCDSLKETAAKQLSCLCSILTSTTLLSSFNATTATAFQFSIACGLKGPSMCSSSGALPPFPEAPVPTPAATALLPSPEAHAPTPAASALPPLPEAPVPALGSTKSDKGAATKIAGTGLTALFFAVVSFVLN